MCRARPERTPAIRILDCAVDPLTMEQALDWCLETCRTGHRARILLTANASHLIEIRDDLSSATTIVTGTDRQVGRWLRA